MTHAYDMEFQCQRARDQSIRMGRPIYDFVNIVDLKGIGMNHASFIRFLKAIAALDDLLYPECLYLTFLVNAPPLFPSIWSLVKMFLDPKVATKVHCVQSALRFLVIQLLSKILRQVVMLGSNPGPTLLEHIDADSLPVEYGGTCRCPGGCVSTFTEAQIQQK